MVSTAMQGGCTCENACLLRIGTGNIEFAALFAPKPMGMSSAKDWTIELPTKGFPDLQKHWAMLGAPDAVKLWHHPSSAQLQPRHPREHLRVLQRTLQTRPARGTLKETRSRPRYPRATHRLGRQHPAPPGGPEFEKKLLEVVV
jgi:hypothetical protein